MIWKRGSGFGLVEEENAINTSDAAIVGAFIERLGNATTDYGNSTVDIQSCEAQKNRGRSFLHVPPIISCV